MIKVSAVARPICSGVVGYVAYSPGSNGEVTTESVLLLIKTVDRYDLASIGYTTAGRLTQSSIAVDTVKNKQ